MLPGQPPLLYLKMPRFNLRPAGVVIVTLARNTRDPIIDCTRMVSSM